MRISEKIDRMLKSKGFDRIGEYNVIRGPKVKSDILECWNVEARKGGRTVTLTSGDTMTSLVKTGLVVKPNPGDSWHYGHYIVEPA